MSASFSSMIGRPAVVALAGVGRRLDLAEERVHLRRLEPPPGADRAVAGHGRGDPVEPVAERVAVRSHSAISSARSRTSAAGIDRAEHRRRLAHRHRARSEAARRRGRARRAPPRARRAASTSSARQIDDVRDEQDLAGDAVGLEPALQPLIDQPLVRRVLVDDDQPVLGLRDDIGLVDLRPRRAERAATVASGGGVGSLHVGRGLRRRAKAACASSAKPARERRAAAP